MAAQVERAPRIDGVLDEALLGDHPAHHRFSSTVSNRRGRSDRADRGSPIAFDGDALYFGFKLFDSSPDQIRRSIIRRDGRQDEDDHIWIGLDTYHDGRNAYIFESNSFGAQGDALISDESMTLSDWNWDGV